MSVESLALVLHHSKAKGTDKLVLVGIANHDGDGGAWPSVETLARYANVHERNVQRAIGKLVALGELAVHPNAGGRQDTPSWQRPNRYDVLVACPATCDGSKNHRPRPMPTAPAGLWITGVAQAPPPGVDATGGGGVDATRTVPRNRDTTGSAYVTGPRASTPPCIHCSAPDLDTCSARQAKLRREDRHTYTPRRLA